MSPRRVKALGGRDGSDPATALREHLIASAEQLLAERPLSTITTRAIARAAGVSDGVLYNYFADKDDLLLAALVRRFSRLVMRFSANLPAPATATVEENLHAYARAALDLYVDASPIVIGLLSKPALLRRFMDEIHRQPVGVQQSRQPIVDYLTGEQHAGRLAAVDVEAATDLLIGATILLSVTSQTGSSPKTDMVQQLSAIVSTLVRGLDPSSSHASSSLTE
jgi:AcrR family transcriptional regulator